MGQVRKNRKTAKISGQSLIKVMNKVVEELRGLRKSIKGNNRKGKKTTKRAKRKGQDISIKLMLKILPSGRAYLRIFVSIYKSSKYQK